MSEYEALRSEILTVMDSLNEYARTVNRYMAVVNDQVAAVWADNAELRDEINAVANRVESLTRAVTTDPAEVAQAIVNDANRSTLREVRGNPYRNFCGRPDCNITEPHLHNPDDGHVIIDRAAPTTMDREQT